MQVTNKYSVRLVVICLSPLLALNANAMDLGVEFRGAIGTSDNLGRSDQNEIDDTIMSVGINVSAYEKTRRLDFRFESLMDYFYYADDSFEEEAIGSFDTELSLNLVEERLRWIFQDTFGQQIVDPLRPATPGNREHVNFFSTGPMINFIPGARNLIQLNAMYSRFDFDARDTDYDQYEGTLSIGRQLRRDRLISFNVSADRIEYDAEVLAPYDRNSAYFRLQTENERNSWAVDLGYGEFEFRGIEGSGLLFQVEMARAVSSNGTLLVSGGSRYTDQGELFRDRQELVSNIDDTSAAATSNAPIRNNFFNISYVIAPSRYTLDATIDWNQENHEDGLGLDRDSFIFSVGIDRDLSRRLFVTGDIEFEHREFKYIDVRDDDFSIGAGLGYNVTPSFRASFEIQRFQRNSELPNQDYVENRAFLRFAYTPPWGEAESR